VRTALLAVLAMVALAAAPLARADGDPASDVLIAQDVYLSYDRPSEKVAKELAETVAAANKAGYRIKVAQIVSQNDLGLIQALWRKPKQYAPFLGRELLFVYKQTLVVVMPNGFGVFRNNDDISREAGLLSGIRIGPGSDGLAEALTQAVRRLSAAAGHPISAGGGSKGSGWLDRVLIGVGAAVLLGVLLVLGETFRRRRSAQLRAEE
jgi:hypothetical protein